jgi:two-component system NarL family response regulator
MGGRVQPRTILLVPGDSDLGDALRAALSQAADFAVVEAATPGRAAQQLQPDAIVMAVCLSTAAGAQLIQSLQHRFPGVKLIAVSDCSPVDALITAARLGAVGHVQAKQPAKALLAAVRRILCADPTVPATIAFDAIRKLSARGTNGVGPALRQLTMRQAEILRLVAEGMTNKEIAHVLGLSDQTVANHVKAILQRLDVHKRTDAAWMLHGGPQELA